MLVPQQGLLGQKREAVGVGKGVQQVAVGGMQVVPHANRPPPHTVCCSWRPAWWLWRLWEAVSWCLGSSRWLWWL